MASTDTSAPKIPRDTENDYTREVARRAPRLRPRPDRGRPGARVVLLVRPGSLTGGNVEHFIGVAQVPIGLAGPLLVNGEHAEGEFYVPLATAEGHAGRLSTTAA